MKCVSYLRVSTEMQGKSGLGPVARRAAVKAYVASIGGDII
jgi:DNA invertase Pin-like site-specific DNA recombinase